MFLLPGNDAKIINDQTDKIKPESGDQLHMRDRSGNVPDAVVLFCKRFVSKPSVVSAIK